MADQYAPEGFRILLAALADGQLPFVTIRSDSMAPLLRRGDRLQLGPVVADGLAVGDIIIVETNQDLLAHRYWGAMEEEGRVYLLTRGDRLAYYDPLTPATSLRAIVRARRRSDRILAIHHGPGAFLNRWLTRLSRLEAQIMRLSLPDSTSEPGPAARPGSIRRFARRPLRMLAAAFTKTVDLLPT